jgi:hypothetical protein
MLNEVFGTQFLVLFALGVVGILLGLIGVLFRFSLPKQRWLRFVLCLLVAGAFLVELIPLAGGQTVGIVLVGLTGVWGLFLVVRSPWGSQVLRHVFLLATLPHALWGILLVGSLCLTTWWLTQASGVSLAPVSTPETHHLFPPRNLKQVPVSPLVTDRGQPVPVYRNEVSVEEVKAFEMPILERFKLITQAMQVAPVDPSYDCHGWVFADGKFWIGGESVRMILEENGYEKVDYPQVGDLAIYGDPNVLIQHSGIVRVAGKKKGDLILIESKWDELGRFLHQPDLTMYQGGCVYFHTKRPGGHRLRGL